MDDDADGAAGFANHVVSVTVVLLGGVLATREFGDEGLIEEFNADDDIGVGIGGIFGGDDVEDGEGVGNRVARCPDWCREFVAGVVVAVLAAWCTVQVDPHLQACLTSPRDGQVNIIGGTLDVWVSIDFLVGPVADRDADRVESSALNALEVRERDPRVPVGFEDVTSIGDVLAKRPFVDYRPVLGFEYRRCDPSVLKSSLVGFAITKGKRQTYASSTSQPPMFTP